MKALPWYWFLICSLSCGPAIDPCALTNGRSVVPGGSLQCLLYLQESGCIECNKRFSILCGSLLGVDGVLVVLRVSGASLDISSFLSVDGANLVWDDDGIVAQCFGIHGSSAVFFSNDGRVDTMIVIRADDLEQVTNLIVSRLPSKEGMQPFEQP